MISATHPPHFCGNYINYLWTLHVSWLSLVHSVCPRPIHLCAPPAIIWHVVSTDHSLTQHVQSCPIYASNVGDCCWRETATYKLQTYESVCNAYKLQIWVCLLGVQTTNVWVLVRQTESWQNATNVAHIHMLCFSWKLPPFSSNRQHISISEPDHHHSTDMFYHQVQYTQNTTRTMVTFRISPGLPVVVRVPPEVLNEISSAQSTINLNMS